MPVIERRRFAHRRLPGPAAIAAAFLALASVAPRASGQTTLGHGQLRLVGASFDVEPVAQAVPVGVPAVLRTVFGGDSAGLAQAGLRVSARLRGPGLGAPVTLRTAPGGELRLPALQVKGEYRLEAISLTDGAGVSIPAAHPVATVTVTDVLVSSISSHVLTPEELADRGIVLDERNLQAFSFALGLSIQGRTIGIELPALVWDGTQYQAVGPPRIEVQGPLPERFQPPTVVAVPLVDTTNAPPPFEEDEQDENGVAPRPVFGLLVFPGNIRFLHQFLSVVLMVQNGSAAGSGLVLKDVSTAVSLPASALRLAGTTPAVADGQPIPVRHPGPDGLLDTPDDLVILAAQQAGSAEMVAEGLKVGTHEVVCQIEATLDGLANQPPLRLSGRARGSVVIRDPSFALTFHHPEVVRKDEVYDLRVTVANTSTVRANRVALALDAASLTGAVVLDVPPGADAVAELGDISPGDASDARFRLRATRTGRVVASAFTSDGSVSGSLRLRTGVTNDGLPLSPDTFVFPSFVSALPAPFVDASTRLIGIAHGLATADATVPGSLAPPDFADGSVRARAVELVAAARRAGIGQPVPSAVADVLLRWLGSRDEIPGFDLVRRGNVRGRELEAAAARALDEVLQTGGRPSFDQMILDAAAANAEPALAGRTQSGPVFVVLSTADPADPDARLRLRGVGTGAETSGGPEDASVLREVPYAALLPLKAPGGGEASLVGRLPASALDVEIVGRRTGAVALDVVYPDGHGGFSRVRFGSISVRAGSLTTTRLTMGAADLDLVSSIDGRRTGNASAALPSPFAAVVAVQDVDANPLGKVVTLLFNRDVAEGPASEPRLWRLPTTTRGGAPLERRVAAVSASTDLRLVSLLSGGVVSPVRPGTARGELVPSSAGESWSGELAIFPRLGLEGGEIEGRVLGPDGTPLPDATVRLAESATDDLSGRSFEATTATTRTDARGSFVFDFVRRQDGKPFRLDAFDPATGSKGWASGSVRQNGDVVHVDVALLGRGTVRGHVVDGTGTRIAGAIVRCSSSVDSYRSSQFSAADGSFVFPSVPVGTLQLQAEEPRTRESAWATARLDVPGAVNEVTLTLAASPRARLSGRVVRGAGGPVAGAWVAGYGATGEYFGARHAPEDGTFLFESAPAGDVRLEVFDGTSREPVLVQPLTLLQDGVHDVTLVVADVTPRFGAVAGVVRRTLGGVATPVAGAPVWATRGGLRTTSGADGAYRIDSLPVGITTVWAQLPSSGRAVSTSATVLEGATAPADLLFTDTSLGSVRGTVVDQVGQPRAGALVEIWEQAPALRLVSGTRSGGDGSFLLQNVPPGSWRLQATAVETRDGTVLRNAGSTTVTVPGPGATATATIALRGFVDVTGRVVARVRDRNGNLVESPVLCTVEVAAGSFSGALPGDPEPGGNPEAGRVFADGPNLAGTVRTDPATGTFRFRFVHGGPIRLVATNPFYGERGADLGLVKGDSARGPIDLAFDGNLGVVDGFLLGADGAPVAGAAVTLSPLDTSFRRAARVDDGRGRRVPLSARSLRTEQPDRLLGLHRRTRSLGRGPRRRHGLLAPGARHAPRGSRRRPHRPRRDERRRRRPAGAGRGRPRPGDRGAEARLRRNHGYGGNRPVPGRLRRPARGPGEKGPRRGTRLGARRRRGLPRRLDRHSFADGAGCGDRPQALGRRGARRGERPSRRRLVEGDPRRGDDRRRGPLRHRGGCGGGRNGLPDSRGGAAHAPGRGVHGLRTGAGRSEGGRRHAARDRQRDGSPPDVRRCDEPGGSGGRRLVARRGRKREPNAPRLDRGGRKVSRRGGSRGNGRGPRPRAVLGPDGPGGGAACRRRDDADSRPRGLTDGAGARSRPCGLWHPPPHRRRRARGPARSGGDPPDGPSGGVRIRRGRRDGPVDSQRFRAGRAVPCRSPARAGRGRPDHRRKRPLRPVRNAARPGRQARPGSPRPVPPRSRNRRLLLQRAIWIPVPVRCPGPDGRRGKRHPPERWGGALGRLEAKEEATGARGTSEVAPFSSDGETRDVTVVVEPRGLVRGRLLLPGGGGPAAAASVVLQQLDFRGLWWVTVASTVSGADGRFDLRDVGFGELVLRASTSAGPIARGETAVALSAAIPVRDTGDLLLDGEGPRVVSVTPADGASGVGLSPVLTAVFSEPLGVALHERRPQEFVELSGPHGIVPVSVSLEADETALRISLPAGASLAGATTYQLRLLESLPDRAGMTLGGDVVVRFTTADLTAPTVLTSVPLPGQIQVVTDANPVVVFTKTLDAATVPSGVSLQRRDAPQGPVSSAPSLRADARTVALNPAAPLEAEAEYEIVVDGVADTAGNRVPFPVRIPFLTLDDRAPVLTLDAPLTPTPLEGSSQTFTLRYAADDVASVRLTLVAATGFLPCGEDAPAPPERSVSFSCRLPLISTAGGTSLVLRAEGSDRSGNSAFPVDRLLTLAPDAPPVLAVTSPAGGTRYLSGTTIRVAGSVEDDHGTATVTARFGDASRSATGTGSFSLTLPVPIVAAPSTLVLEVVAVDTAGNAARPVTIPLGVDPDVTFPSISIAAPDAGESSIGGRPVSLVASATDDATGVSLRWRAASGAWSAPEGEALSVLVPTPFVGAETSFLLELEARDGAGNVSAATRSVRLLPNLAPGLIVTAPGHGFRVTAETSFLVTGTASDDGGVPTVTATYRGSSRTATGTSFSLSFQAPAVSAPTETVVRVVATDAEGNSSTPVDLFVTVVPDAGGTPTIVLSPPAPAVLLADVGAAASLTYADNVGLEAATAEVTGGLTSGGRLTFALAGANADKVVPLTTAAVPFGTPARVSATLRNVSARTASLDVALPVAFHRLESPLPAGAVVEGGLLPLTFRLTSEGRARAAALRLEIGTRTAAGFSALACVQRSAPLSELEALSIGVPAGFPGLVLRSVLVEADGSEAPAADSEGRFLFERPLATTADAVAPTVAIGTPAEAASFTAGAPVAVEVSAADDVRLRSIEVTFAGITKACLVSPCRVSFFAPRAAAPTIQAISAVAKDASGRSSSATVSVTVSPAAGAAPGAASVRGDGRKPRVSFVTPALSPAAVPPRSTYVPWVDATDEDGIETMELFLGDGAAEPCLVLRMPEDSWPPRKGCAIPDVADGTELALVARATDRAGESAQARSVLVVREGLRLRGPARLAERGEALADATLYVEGDVSVEGELLVGELHLRAGAVLRPRLDGATPDSIRVRVRGDLVLDAGSRIDASATGVRSVSELVAGTPPSREGEGAPHGGEAGVDGTIRAAYGSASAPLLPGARGGVAGTFGGGMVSLLAKRIVLAGVVAADGEDGNRDRPAWRGLGAGGSIFLVAEQAVTGPVDASPQGFRWGVVSARGGDPSPAEAIPFTGAFAAGGRISLSARLLDLPLLDVSGTIGPEGTLPGRAGSIFVRDALRPDGVRIVPPPGAGEIPAVEEMP
ncbi:MAG: carboxypeptidase regulatory-like domain-containing protein [Holophagales bacterium]|nr:carboxypeptidase regulatory-like domain-containing protein [Holophagales bacterium]